MLYMHQNDQEDLNRTILANHHHHFVQKLSHKGANWHVINCDVDLATSMQNQKGKGTTTARG